MLLGLRYAFAPGRDFKSARLPGMSTSTRRKFMTQMAAGAGIASLSPVVAPIFGLTAAAAASEPNIRFPTEPRERIWRVS